MSTLEFLYLDRLKVHSTNRVECPSAERHVLGRRRERIPQAIAHLSTGSQTTGRADSIA
jgi:hypothetical protein